MSKNVPFVPFVLFVLIFNVYYALFMLLFPLTGCDWLRLYSLLSQCTAQTKLKAILISINIKNPNNIIQAFWCSFWIIFSDNLLSLSCQRVSVKRQRHNSMLPKRTECYMWLTVTNRIPYNYDAKEHYYSAIHFLKMIEIPPELVADVWQVISQHDNLAFTFMLLVVAVIESMFVRFVGFGLADVVAFPDSEMQWSRNMLLVRSLVCHFDFLVFSHFSISISMLSCCKFIQLECSMSFADDEMITFREMMKIVILLLLNA